MMQRDTVMPDSGNCVEQVLDLVDEKRDELARPEEIHFLEQLMYALNLRLESAKRDQAKGQLIF